VAEAYARFKRVRLLALCARDLSFFASERCSRVVMPEAVFQRNPLTFFVKAPPNSALLFQVSSLQKGGSNVGVRQNIAYSPSADVPPP
jgi:hypothetical protein